MRLLAASAALLVSLATGCGGGGGSAAPAAPATSTPASTPTCTASTVPLISCIPVTAGTLTVPFPALAAGYSGQLVANSLVPTSSPATMQAALSLTTPPALSLAVNAPKPVVAYTGSNGSTPTVLSYAELTPSVDLTVNGSVTLTFGFPAGTLQPQFPYLYAFWFGQLTGVSWLDGNAVSSVDFNAQTVTITGTPAAFGFSQFRAGFIYGFAVYHN